MELKELVGTQATPNGEILAQLTRSLSRCRRREVVGADGKSAVATVSAGDQLTPHS
jgi:hypothetical protein